MRNRNSDNRMKSTSKFISLILRHNPGAVGISLDEHGWADVQELIAGINRSGGRTLDMETLEEIVRTDEKQRYSFNEDHTLIPRRTFSGMVRERNMLLLLMNLG